jgi:glycerol uptake facilitator-like aquaporin
MKSVFKRVSVPSFVWLVTVGSSGGAFAQQLPSNNPVSAQIVAAEGVQAQQSLGSFFTSRTPYEFWLTVLIVAFTTVLLSIVLFFFRTQIEKHAEQLIRFIIVLVIVAGTLILIVAGYSNEQVAPAFGLFGTIVGYILGRMSNVPPVPDQNDVGIENDKQGRK